MPTVASISQQIWDMKYRLRGPANGPTAGEAVDKTIEDSWRRVARACAEPEKDPAPWSERFYRTMEDFRFLPAGRVLAGAGAGRQVTLFNCFVMGAIPDDMSGIFAAPSTPLRSACDLSGLRLRGSRQSGIMPDLFREALRCRPSPRSRRRSGT